MLRSNTISKNVKINLKYLAGALIICLCTNIANAATGVRVPHWRLPYHPVTSEFAAKIGKVVEKLPDIKVGYPLLPIVLSNARNEIFLQFLGALNLEQDIAAIEADGADNSQQARVIAVIKKAYTERKFEELIFKEVEERVSRIKTEISEHKKWGLDLQVEVSELSPFVGLSKDILLLQIVLMRHLANSDQSDGRVDPVLLEQGNHRLEDFMGYTLDHRVPFDGSNWREFYSGYRARFEAAVSHIAFESLNDNKTPLQRRQINNLQDALVNLAAYSTPRTKSTLIEHLGDFALESVTQNLKLIATVAKSPFTNVYVIQMAVDRIKRAAKSDPDTEHQKLYSLLILDLERHGDVVSLPWLQKCRSRLERIRLRPVSNALKHIYWTFSGPTTVDSIALRLLVSMLGVFILALPVSAFIYCISLISLLL